LLLKRWHNARTDNKWVSLMKLTQLRHMVAVAERGSLRAAARDLGIAQPAVTRSIQELEREFGVPLFERHARGVFVTDMGQLLLRRAGAIINEVRRAQEEIAQSQGGTAGTVAVAFSSVPHISMLPQALRPFRKRYPKIWIRIIEAVYPMVEAGLLDGSIDFYVGPLHRQSLAPGLSETRLFDNERVVLARKGHPLAGARSLRDLKGAEWLTTSITHSAEEELRELFERHRMAVPNLVVRAQSAFSAMTVLAATDLMALMPIQWTNFELTRGSLQRINVRERIAAPPIVLVRRAALALTPAAELLADLLRRATSLQTPLRKKS
jgi:LysR family transcriptional regulator, regulator of abg operon